MYKCTVGTIKMTNRAFILKELKEKRKEMRKFCDRVERGEIKANDRYREYLYLLSQPLPKE